MSSEYVWTNLFSECIQGRNCVADLTSFDQISNRISNWILYLLLGNPSEACLHLVGTSNTLSSNTCGNHHSQYPLFVKENEHYEECLAMTHPLSRTKHVWYSEHGTYYRFEFILERAMSATHVAVILCMRTSPAYEEEFMKMDYPDARNEYGMS